MPPVDQRTNPDFVWKDCDWVLYKPCGCIEGMTSATYPYAGRVIDSEPAAWKELFSDRRSYRNRHIQQAKRDGYTVGLLLRREAVQLHMLGCAHVQEEKAYRVPLTAPQERALRTVHGNPAMALESLEHAARGISRPTLRVLAQHGLITWEDLPEMSFTWGGKSYRNKEWRAEVTSAGAEWLGQGFALGKEADRVLEG